MLWPETSYKHLRMSAIVHGKILVQQGWNRKTKKLIIFIYVVVMGILKGKKVFDGIFFLACLRSKWYFYFDRKQTNKSKIQFKNVLHAIRMIPITITYIVIYNSRSIKLLYHPVAGW